MPNNWPISIAVINNDGDMAYSRSVQHVSSGDTISWSSETGSFTLTFQDSILVDGLQIQSTNTAPFTATATVKNGAAIGRHYYSVAALFNGNIYTDPGCPEIVVQ
jgi:hypothetical protein